MAANVATAQCQPFLNCYNNAFPIVNTQRKFQGFFLRVNLFCVILDIFGEFTRNVSYWNKMLRALALAKPLKVRWKTSISHSLLVILQFFFFIFIFFIFLKESKNEHFACNDRRLENSFRKQITTKQKLAIRFVMLDDIVINNPLFTLNQKYTHTNNARKSHVNF